MARQGVLVEPYQRLKMEQVEQIHRASLAILTDPGVVSRKVPLTGYSKYLRELFRRR